MIPALRISTVRYQNFGPFADVTVDFSKPGLTGIEGIISWKPGFNSNGSGKSFLIDGPAWCLWGRCLREDYKGDDVVRIGSTGGTCVETDVIGGEQPIRVVRYRQHPKHKNRVYLFVGGEDVTRGTDVETQAVIDHLLQDFLTAQNNLFFGAREDVRSFFVAPDALRKQVLDQLLGLTLYASAEKVARRRLAQLATILIPLRERKAKLDGALSARKGVLESLQASEDVDALTFAARLADLRVLRCQKALARRTAFLAEAREELAFEEDQASGSMAVYTRARDEYARARSTLERDVRTASANEGSASTLLQRAQSDLKKHEATAGKSCSACGQKLPKDRHEQMLSALTVEVSKQTAAVEAAKNARATAEAALASLVEPIQPDFPDVDAARAYLALEERREDIADSRLTLATERAKNARDLLERATTQVAQTKAAIEAIEKDIQGVLAEIAEKETLSDRLTFWVEGFGNQGLKSFLIEAEIARINKLACSYAQRLLGPGAVVRLSATTQLKSSDAVREKLSIEAKVPGCTTSYQGASKGQKRRLDLALMLAFRDIVAERSEGAFRQFFADELFDGLDQTGTEFAIEQLREVSAKDCPVILVTHNLQLKSAVDRVITVRHEKEYLATATTASGKVPRLKAIPATK